MFTKNKKTTILLKDSGSAYLAINRAFINRKSKIGSSISGVSMVIQCNKGEMLKSIMPSIIGLSPTSNDWDKQVRLYLDSISVTVPEDGLTLETGFTYENEEKYDEYFELYTKIENTYDNKVKANPSDKDVEAKAFKNKYEALCNLEGNHYKYGSPIKPADWLLYFYCLHYGDVANREEDIDASVRIRFYIHDEQLAERRKQRNVNVANQADDVYMKIYKDESKIEDILIAAEKINIDANISSVDRLISLREFRDKSPVEFVGVANDKKLIQKSFIKRCLSMGILKKLPYVDTIVDKDNDIKGNNIDEVIVKMEKDVVFKNSLESQVKSKMIKDVVDEDEEAETKTKVKVK